MENNKLFKAHISNMLNIEVKHFYSTLHEQEQQRKDIENKISKNSKYHKASVLVAGGIGLLAIGMAVANKCDIYKINEDIIHAGFVATLFAGAMSSKVYKHLNNLIKSHFEILKEPISYKHEQFEQNLVEELNKKGYATEFKYISTIEDYFELKNLWKTSDNYEAELHQKTTEYVEKIINAYIEPEEKQKQISKANKNKP